VGEKGMGLEKRERGGKEKQYYGILFSFALFWFVFLSPFFPFPFCSCSWFWFWFSFATLRLCALAFPSSTLPF
jgi:hypothetical protein